MTPEREVHELLRAPSAQGSPTVLAAGELTADAPQAHPRLRLRVGVPEIALLGAWDLSMLILVFVATGAFGSSVKGRLAGVGIALLGLTVIAGVGGYQRTVWLRAHLIDLMRQLLIASTVVAWASVLVTLVLGLHAHLTDLAIAWAVLPLAWCAGRQVMRVVRKGWPERILIVGSGSAARQVAELWGRPGSGGSVVGLVDDHIAPDTPTEVPVLGGIDQLPALLAGKAIDRVIVAFSARRDRETLDVLRSCAGFSGPVDVVPRFFEFGAATGVRTYGGPRLALASIPGRQSWPASTLIKRMFDLVGSLILLVVLSPLLLFAAVATLLDSGRPVLFRERRIGIHGRPFWIIKFRTLDPAGSPSESLDLNGRDDTERESEPGVPEPEPIALQVERAKREAALRATRLGTFLRETSLDELPQLFNVLVGQMSLVGPRPLSPREDAALEGWEVLRRSVRPGITGLWQVSGRSEISWRARINLDYAEVRHWSLWSDLHVLADTVREVVHRRGAR